MGAQAVIVYEELLQAYWDNLTTVLRGFNPGEEFQFLETWVPDEDDCESSIISIVDAAQNAGLSKISLQIGFNTFRDLSMSRLEDQAATRGKVALVTRVAGVDLEVSFAKSDGILLDIHPAYREELGRVLESRYHKGLLNPRKGLVLVRALHAGTTLSALVNPANHIVVRASYQGAKSEVQSGLLEALCTVFEGKPLQECGDHGVLWVEERLRSRSQPAPVAGILTPDNADPSFALLVKLARGMDADYRQKTGYNGSENCYVQPASPAWQKLSSAERIISIQTGISSHPVGGGIVVKREESVSRFTIEFNDLLDSNSKQERIMQLESHLRSVVEPTIHLHMEPKEDQNRARGLREVHPS